MRRSRRRAGDRHRSRRRCAARAAVVCSGSSYVLLERAAETLHGAVEMTLHAAGGDAEESRDVLGGAALELAQGEHLPLSAREARERGPHAALRVAPDDLVL